MRASDVPDGCVSSSRVEIRRLLRAVPCRPFALNLQNGDRIVIEASENIALDPAHNGSPGSSDFYVISGGLRLFSTFEAVTSMTLADEGR